MISDLPSFSTSSTCSSRIAFTLTARGPILTGRIHIPLNWFIPLSKWVKLWFQQLSSFSCLEPSPFDRRTTSATTRQINRRNSLENSCFSGLDSGPTPALA
jgi:hypothetical protein